ncbi:hypothetical protein BSSC8_15680 [Bacillus subtilis subsp. subtilis str. SC-8]|nr:hypothetical protein BSSC8_15680 [Bacillus subtilis subsp. subtilis str. SC-8]
MTSSKKGSHSFLLLGMADSWKKTPLLVPPLMIVTFVLTIVTILILKVVFFMFFSVEGKKIKIKYKFS